MQLTVRLFALARQRAGRAVVTLDVPEPATVAALKRALADACPELSPLVPQLMIAVDADYAGDDATPISPGADVAAIPPVSGGRPACVDVSATSRIREAERPITDTDCVASDVAYRVRPPVTNEALNELFKAAWRDHTRRDFRPILDRSLAYVCAYDAGRLVGFVNLAWDGGVHAFLLDTTVHPDRRRCGIGRRLVKHAEAVARDRGIEWLHVDFEPHLRDFYRGCGFRPTDAGLIGFEPDCDQAEPD